MFLLWFSAGFVVFMTILSVLCYQRVWLRRWTLWNSVQQYELRSFFTIKVSTASSINWLSGAAWKRTWVYFLIGGHLKSVSTVRCLTYAYVGCCNSFMNIKKRGSTGYRALLVALVGKSDKVNAVVTLQMARIELLLLVSGQIPSRDEVSV